MKVFAIISKWVSAISVFRINYNDTPSSNGGEKNTPAITDVSPLPDSLVINITNKISGKKKNIGTNIYLKISLSD